MTTTIYITLLVLTIISGLIAVSPTDNKEKQKEETVVSKLGLQSAVDFKKQLYSKLIAMVVFILSLASLMTMYFIKG